MIEEQIHSSDALGQAAVLIGKERLVLAEVDDFAKDYDDIPMAERTEADDMIYASAAAAHAEAGEFERADAYVQKNLSANSSWSSRDAAQTAIAGALAYYGRYDEAKARVDTIESSENKARAEVDVCIGMVRRGDTKVATQAADQIERSWLRAEARIAIAVQEGSDSPLWEQIDHDLEEGAYPKAEVAYVEALARVGRLEQARRVYDEMVADSYATVVGNDLYATEAGVAIAKVEGVDSDMWMIVKRSIDGSYSQGYEEDLCRKELAIGFAAIGQQDEALRILEGIREPLLHSDATLGIHLAAHDYDAAMSVLPAIRSRSDPEDNHDDEALLSIIKEQAAHGDIAEAERTTRYLNSDQNVLQACRAIVAAANAKLHELGVAKEEVRPEVVLGMEMPGPAAVRNVGAFALEHWRKFKDFDAVTFSRLAKGAAEIASSYMTDDERQEFVRKLGREFTKFRDEGMFEEGKHQVVLKNLSEALNMTGDAGATSVLLETLYANMGEATGLRLIKTLVESGNAKAGAAAIAMLADAETPTHAYQYLLHKLADTGYIDEDLPDAILERQQAGFPAVASRRLLQRYYEDMGIQLDAKLLEWTVEQMYGSKEFTARLTPHQVMMTLDDNLEAFMERVQSSRVKFEEFSQTQLLGLLSTSEHERALYYLLHGNKTKYALIQHYNLTKFTNSLHMARRVEDSIDERLIDKNLWRHAPFGWQEAMETRRRPDQSLVWQLEVGSSDEELRTAARNELRSVLGPQLQWLLGDGKYAKNFSEMPDQPPALPEATQKRLTNLFGDQIQAILRGEDRDVAVGDFEKIKNTMLAQLRQLRLHAKQQHDPSHAGWKSLLEQAENEDPILSMRHVIALIEKDPTSSLRPQGAIAEWYGGHLAGLNTSIRDSQRKSKDNRSLTIRYLDGKEDFAEMLRFADGAQCCFTSESTTSAELDPQGEWRMRINRDPHWFVFSIEDTPPDATTRVSSGFVFGSVAEVDGRPALALNGIYMQRKTDSAANAVLDDIVERFAKPMGVDSVVIATKHGGDFSIDKSKWEPAEGHEIFRPRAIRSTDSIAESYTYDDLGTAVNKEVELGSQTWRRIIRR